jgi:xanthine dehydrogenase accessory factor
MKDILSSIEQIKCSGKKAALCIIIETRGSSPRKAGSKMIVYENENIEGTIGGGSLELRVIEDAQQVISSGHPRKFNYELEEDLAMNCGGYAEVYIEPILPKAQLYIFGAGHIGKALIKYAPDFGFDIKLIDHRENIFDSDVPKNISFLNEAYVSAANSFEFNTSSYIVIVTPKHAYDEEVMAICAKKEFAYLGMIGSKVKIAKARKRMLGENILTEEQLNKVNMPIGVKFNAQTPEEIAVSILAKLIDVKNSND